MNQFEQRTLSKKKAIIDAAMTLFSQKGFTQVSIKELASAAHVSQVSIYNYFGSKEALIGECAKLIMAETATSAREILAAKAPFEQKIEQVLLLCQASTNRSISQYLSAQAAEDKPFIASLIAEINLVKKQLYLAFITEGQKENVISSEFSAESIELFIDAISSAGLSLKDHDNARIQAELIQLFLHGILS